MGRWITWASYTVLVSYQKGVLSCFSLAVIKVRLYLAPLHFKKPFLFASKAATLLLSCSCTVQSPSEQGQISAFLALKFRKTHLPYLIGPESLADCFVLRHPRRDQIPLQILLGAGQDLSGWEPREKLSDLSVCLEVLKNTLAAACIPQCEVSQEQAREPASDPEDIA